MNNVKTLLGLRGMLFNMQSRHEKFISLSTLKTHLEYYIGFQVNVDYEEHRDHVIASFKVGTDNNEISVKIKLCIYTQFYQFRSFEVTTLKAYDLNNQNNMMLQQYNA